MNKLLIGLIIFGLCCVSLVSIVDAANIAYVVKTKTNPSVLNVINQTGYDIDVITSAKIAATNWSKYDLLVVNGDDFGSTLAAKIPVNTKNSIVLDANDLSKWGWISSDPTSKIDSPRIMGLIVVNNSVAISSGLGTSFMPYVSGGTSYTINYIPNARKAPNVKIMATQSLDSQNRPNGAVVAFVEAGSQLSNGKTSLLRGVFFGLPNADLWSNEAKQIFRNSMSWALEGLDKDHDSFLYNVDCNDNNPNINPNATEIPYNGIDDNCDGFDQADVDNDGYCKVGYAIQNKALQCAKETGNIGTDCNDDDSTVNPGSIDLTRNCVNDLPVQIRTIPNQTWNEDNNLTLNLNDYFSDPEGQLLRYGVYATTNNPNIAMYIDRGLILFVPAAGWHGADWIIFNISDGTNAIRSNNVTLSILPINHAPVLNAIDNITVVEGQTVIVRPTASDVDNDTLTFLYESPLNSSGMWQTKIGDKGSYRTTVTVSDSKLSSSKSVNINVIEKILINEFVSNSNNKWVELYNPGTREAELEGFTLEARGDKKTLTGKIPPKGFFVIENINLSSTSDSIVLKLRDYVVDSVSYSSNAPARDFSLGRDPDGTTSWKTFSKPTKGLSSTADMNPPVVELISPVTGTIFNIRNVNLSYKVSDNRNVLSCQIFMGVGDFIGGESKEALNNTVSNFIVSSLTDGTYNWNVKCFDGTNNVFASQNKTFRIDAPDAPVFDSVSDQSVNENETVSFTVLAIDIDSNDLISYSALNLPSGAQFDSITGIFTWKPGFNQAGNYVVSFTATDNTNLSTTMNVNINVVNFELPPEFSDADHCSVINNSIRLTIKDPNKNEKFEIGEEIQASVRIKNDAKGDISLDVRAYLYDLTGDKIFEEANDESVDINKGDSQDVDFRLVVPKGVDKEHNYTVYVIAQDGDLCNIAYTPVKLERSKESLEIKTLDLNPEIVRRGDIIKVMITVGNIGTKDLGNVYVRLFNSVLGLDSRSGVFDINKYDSSKDTKKIEMSFKIPDNVSDGNYKINAEAIYGTIRANASQEILVKGSIPAASEQIPGQGNAEIVQPVSNGIVYTDSLNQGSVIKLDSNKKVNVIQTEKTTSANTISGSMFSVKDELSKALIPVDIFLIIAIFLIIIAISYLANRKV